MTKNKPHKPQLFELVADREDLLHLHACLTDAKNAATKRGAVWSEHGINAQLRTRIELLLAI